MRWHFIKLLTLKSNNPALRGADDNVVTILLQNTASDKVFSYLRKMEIMRFW